MADEYEIDAQDVDWHETALSLQAALTAEQQAHRALRSWADGAKVDLDALQTELAAEQQAHERTRADRDGWRLATRINLARIQTAEATLEARNREVERLREALHKIANNRFAGGFADIALVALAAAAPTAGTADTLSK